MHWLEPPNLERGGWSGVGRWQFSLDTGTETTLFIKRQQNHMRRSIRAPITGVPTFMIEYHFLNYLSQHGIKVPQLVFFGTRNTIDGHQALLATIALEGYQDFSHFCAATCITNEKGLLETVAKTIRQLHRTGVQHRALYPKHVFVATRESGYEVAFIDLEKARYMRLPSLQAWRDLRQFLSRLPDWTDEMRYRFYQSYTGRVSGVRLALGWWWLRRTLL